jgi:hypothetical protein
MKTNNPQIEQYRVRHGNLASDESYGNNGYFVIPTPSGITLYVVASDGMGFDHVSVHPANNKRTPTWEEMCFIKDLFFEPEEYAIQIHPPESDYVDLHPFTLHLWRPQNQQIVLPNPILVGVGRKKRKKHR